MAERVARLVVVTGRVQGVFYRAWTNEIARALGVGGWVRNRSDGSVEAFLEGDEAAVQQVIQKMRSGPPAARVEDLQISDSDPEHADGFEVRH